MEACGGRTTGRASSRALGHQVLLLPPQYVKAYVKRNKNDAADAEAICEAMSRPRMRFVPTKSAEQQAALMLVGRRDTLVRRRTQLSNAIRGYAAEFGLVAAKGLHKIEPLLRRIAADESCPISRRTCSPILAKSMPSCRSGFDAIEARLRAWHKGNETSRRLAEIPASDRSARALMVMKVNDPHAFRCARDFSAWIGLTPKDHSTAGKMRLGVITRAGDEALRSVLVAGATAVIQQVRKGRGRSSGWLIELLKRKEPKLAAVALANKTARIAWKLMVSGERYDPQKAESRFVHLDASVAPHSRRQGRCAPPSAVAVGQP